MTHPTCKNCPHFTKRHDPDDGTGQCRLAPPLPGVNAQGARSSHFPVVFTSEWCSEHPGRQPRELTPPPSVEGTFVPFPSVAGEVIDDRRLATLISNLCRLGTVLNEAHQQIGGIMHHKKTERAQVVACAELNTRILIVRDYFHDLNQELVQAENARKKGPEEQEQ